SSGLIPGAGPFATAVLRTTEIALGSLASVAVSLIVFPSRAKAQTNELAAAILHRLAEWLRAVPRENDAKATETLREELRAELRELGVLAHTAGWRRGLEGQNARVLRVLTALHGDVGFLVRAIARKPLRIEASAPEFGAPLAA